MKKTTLIATFILGTAFFISSSANATERTSEKAVKKETKAVKQSKKQAKPLDQICTDNRLLYTTCCDGEVMVTGYVDYAYWCESGATYNVNIFMVDGCGYGCA